MSALSPSSVRRKRRFTWRRLVLGLVVLLTVCGIVGYFLIHSTPGWYEPISADDPRVDEYALAAQGRFLELHNAVGRLPLGEQTWTITENQINAFLTATYGNTFLTGRAMARNGMISGPMIRFTPGVITLAARTPKVPSSEAGGGVVTIGFRVETIPAERAAMGPGGEMGLVTLQGVWVGAMPVPPGLVRGRAEQVGRALEPAIRQAIASNVGPRSAAIEGPQIISTVNHIVRGEAFGLSFVSGNHRMIIKDIRVTEGQFAMTLAPG